MNGTFLPRNGQSEIAVEAEYSSRLVLLKLSARRFVFAGQCIFNRSAHQRGIFVAEQNFTEANRRRGLRLAIAARLAVTAAQRLHQRLRLLLDMMMHVGIGP